MFRDKAGNLSVVRIVLAVVVVLAVVALEMIDRDKR